MNGAPLTRTPPRRSWGRGPPPQGWRRIQARRSTCLLLRAVQRRRVESLVLGALSSSPIHRALVLGTDIAVLLDCSKSSRQCSLSYFYLLTYFSHYHTPTNGAHGPRRTHTSRSSLNECASRNLRAGGGVSRRVHVWPGAKNCSVTCAYPIVGCCGSFLKISYLRQKQVANAHGIGVGT